MPALDRLFDHPDNPIPPGAACGSLVAADGKGLRWATFPPLAAHPRGTVLLLQGRGEYVERWFETIRDLQVRGFAVATFDWRGQGGSERLTRHPHKGHVGSFRAYGLDLEGVLAGPVAGLPRPLFVLAHSTGGLIAAAEIGRLAPHVSRIVMASPFFGLGDFGVPVGFARKLAKTLRNLGFGRGWVFGGGATAVHTRPFAENRLTSDPVRHARAAELSSSNRRVAIGSPTIGWLAAAFAAQDRVFAPDALDAWRMPTLVLACSRDEVVDGRAAERFVVSTRMTELMVIPGARHELLHERDLYREQFWAAFDAFVPGTQVEAPAAPTPEAVPTPEPEPEREPEIAAEPGVAPQAADEPAAETPVAAAPVAAAAVAVATIAATVVVEEAPAAAASAEGETLQEDVVEPGIAGGDDAAAVGGAAAGPGGDDAAGALDHRDQGDDVVGLEPALDHGVDEARGDHAVGVAVDPVARQPDR